MPALTWLRKVIQSMEGVLQDDMVWLARTGRDWGSSMKIGSEVCGFKLACIQYG